VQHVLLKRIKEIYPEICALRQRIHSCPELGYGETQTSKTIYEFLTAHGVCAEMLLPDTTGVVAHIDSKKSRVIGFRADIDALPIVENTGVPFSSRCPGVMHACGHDMHTAIAAGLAVVLNGMKTELPVNVRILFQPAEECNPEGGAKKMIDRGCLRGLDFLIGLHVWPELPAGKIGVRPGYLMAASDKFHIAIRGKKSHAAEPHKGVDAIAVGIQAVSMIKSIISQESDPLEAAIISIGEFNSNGRYNIICNEVEIKGTIRTFEPELRDRLHARIREILDGLDLACRVTHELHLEKGYNAVCNDEKIAISFAADAKKTLGDDNVDDAVRRTLVGEDFSFYGDHLPILYFFLGAGCPYPLHSDMFLPKEEIMQAALKAVGNYIVTLN